MKAPDIQVIRESIGKIVTMLTQKRIKVTQRGVKAYVAYHKVTGAIELVNIPYLPDNATPDFISAVQGFLDHEVGHVLFTDQKVVLASHKLGPKVANMANLIEDVFVERKMTDTFPGASRNLEAVRKFFLEKISGPKIKEALKAGDTATATGYAVMPAFRAWGGQISSQDFIKDPDVAKLIAPVRTKLGEDWIKRLQACKSSQDCLDLAVLGTKALEPPPPPPPPPAPMPSFPALPPPPPPPPGDEDGEEQDEEDSAASPETEASPAGDKEGEGEESGGPEEKPEKGDEEKGDEEKGDEEEEDGAELEMGAPEVGDDDTPAPAPTPDDDDDDDGDGEGEGEEGGTEPGDDGDEAPGGGRGDEGDGQEQDEDGGPTPGTASGSDEGDEPGPGPGDEDSPASSPGEDHSDLFKEERDFDDLIAERLTKESEREFSRAQYQIYSTEWDKVEVAEKSTSAHKIAEIEKGTEGTLGVMQKQLERAIAAQARKSWNPAQRRGRIAPGALFKSAVGDDRLFRQRYETRAKNTAMTLLVDCSGSMVYSDAITIAGKAAFALSSVLERIKIQHEVIGFTTYRSNDMLNAMRADATGAVSEDSFARDEAIYMPVFKGFNERLNSETKARLAMLMGNSGFCRNNVDGESVQMAAHRLRLQKAERHIMFVLSDGEPNCSGGYSASNQLRSHLKSSVAAVELSGIEVIGIGIESTAVKSYYTKHVVLNNLAELPTTVMKQLTSILLSD